MTWRRFVLITHRWIGLATSLVLVIAGGTGAVMVWRLQGQVYRAIGRIHEDLALGRAGAWIVVLSTAAAVLLQAGGLILWWKRKRLRVRLSSGWQAAFNDLHHAVGAAGFVIMLIIAGTGMGMGMVGPGPVRKTLVDFHTSRTFPLAVDVVYALGSLGFVVQGISGVVMWLKARR